MKTIIYTCITKGYDELLPPQGEFEGIEFICINDGNIVVPPPWINIPITGDLSGALLNRHAKICYFEYECLNSAEILIYVDGSISITGDTSDLVNNVISNDGHTFLYEHPQRDCVYDEAKACFVSMKSNLKETRRFLERIRAAGLPKNLGLFEGGVIIRKAASIECKRLMLEWWQEYLNGIKRDQLALIFSAWKAGTNITSLGRADHRFTHKYFQCRDGHKGDAFKRNFTWWVWRPIIELLLARNVIKL
ncbi:hypothetical protein [Leptothrix discophora]|uniref:DUF616 domain-containing protein n=1 Tax=Leptothrix discophora TaxID=89 RepID=A0ABT9G0Y2_LEPDI|nr:hypothetical protein [Leptothrix discophora]MDP4299853.1 hypothetical protein [Leptothrix discophora]